MSELSLYAESVDDRFIRLQWNSTSSPYNIQRSIPYSSVMPTDPSSCLPLFLASNVSTTEFEDHLISNSYLNWYGFGVSAIDTLVASTNQVSRIELEWDRPKIIAINQHGDKSNVVFHYNITDANGNKASYGPIVFAPRILQYNISINGSIGATVDTI